MAGPSDRSDSVIANVRCPRCAAVLNVRVTPIHCAGCDRIYPLLGNIPILLKDPEAYLASCRKELTFLDQQSDATIRAIEEQLQMPAVLPLTQDRCAAMIEAIREQAADIRSILDPLLPADIPDSPHSENARDYPAPLEYIHTLYRDWGWPEEKDGENERALASVEGVSEGRPMGRTLVIGAGACRLAYDLHRRDPEAETVVMDIDAFLFAAAHAVIRGDTISIREANSEIAEIGHVSRQWEMKAPGGPLDLSRFHFMLADGLAPPFAPETFDTIVTPWFIDLIPPDLRDFIGTVRRLLKPGGSWLNLGPLRYGPQMPLPLRFSREEIFDLAERAGFRIERWQSESAPYLVSRLNGRGKVEWVLAFRATRLDELSGSDDARGATPSWLVLPHLPVPTFPGQSLFVSDASLVRLVIASIDGRRTLDDLALLVATQARQPGVSLGQIRDAVRRCLVQVHPDA